jgi:hypothetical protein
MGAADPTACWRQNAHGSVVTAGEILEWIVVAAYPSHARTRNARRDTRGSVVAPSDDSAASGCKLTATPRLLTS